MNRRSRSTKSQQIARGRDLGVHSLPTITHNANFERHGWSKSSLLDEWIAHGGCE
jgi:hypothetical protein